MITGSKTTCYTNCMVFQLQNIKPLDKISPQHANFLNFFFLTSLKDIDKENRKFFQNVFPNFVESKRNNFKLFRLHVFSIYNCGKRFSAAVLTIACVHETTSKLKTLKKPFWNIWKLIHYHFISFVNGSLIC